MEPMIVNNSRMATINITFTGMINGSH